MKSPIIFIIFAIHSVYAQKWHENANFYQIYPRSFKDSDGDGIGDIQGVISNLRYLQELGIDGIWLNPIMKSPQIDAGYDISDYREIEPLFGTMKDFEELIDRTKSLGIHLIMDFVPNHTSNEHEWFIKSENKEVGYEDYYIWHPGFIDESEGAIRPRPPNEWVSVMVGSMWEWSEKRKEYYFHQFMPQQPDLNYRNPKVVEEMKNVMRFWLNKGISGFRIDAVPCLFEVAPDTAEFLLQEPPSGECDNPALSCYYKHIYTQNQSETYDMVSEWRKVLDEFSSTESKIMMLEVAAPPEDLQRYHLRGADIPFNFEPLLTWTKETSAREMRNFIENYLSYIPSGYSPNWVLGNHDQKRLATRFGTNRIDLYNTLIQTLPGHAVTYNGEEIGMTDVFISWQDTQDPQACATNSTFYVERTRDPTRTPFQWSNEKNAGFSTAEKTWLPVGPDYETVNVKNQLVAEQSHLKIFKELIKFHKLMKESSFKFSSKINMNENILIYMRKLSDVLTYVIAINFENKSVAVNLYDHFSKSDIPSKFRVEMTSLDSGLIRNQLIYNQDLVLPAESAVVLRAKGFSFSLSITLKIFFFFLNFITYLRL